MKIVSLSITRLVMFMAFACLILVTDVDAQAGRNISTVGRRLDDFNRQAERAERDELAREMDGRKLKPEERRRAEARKVEIREDLESLQTSYNDVVTRLHGKEVLSATYLAELTEKVSKSSVRLRGNIAFPPQKSIDTKSSQVAAIPASIESLCLHLLAFLTSPIFESGVLDLIETEKARDALDKIIHTSETIRERSGKTH